MQINLMEILFEYRCKQQILSSLEQSFARISFYLKFYWIPICVGIFFNR